MAEDVAGGDLVEARIAVEEAGLRIVGERLVERDLAGLDQLHHGIGEDRLAHGRGFEHACRW